MVCFRTKNPNLGQFWRALDWKNGYILWPFEVFYGHLGYFMTIWYILCSFGTFLPVLVSWAKKNLATLPSTAARFSVNAPFGTLEPILRLRNLQLQRQRCNRLHRAFFEAKFFFKTH
jgi:hypothetical protein